MAIDNKCRNTKTTEEEIEGSDNKAILREILPASRIVFRYTI
jgi:hypothetical protein